MGLDKDVKARVAGERGGSGRHATDESAGGPITPLARDLLPSRGGVTTCIASFHRSTPLLVWPDWGCRAGLDAADRQSLNGRQPTLAAFDRAPRTANAL